MRNWEEEWKVEKRNAFVYPTAGTLGYIVAERLTRFDSRGWPEIVPGFLLAVGLAYIFQFALFGFLKWRDNWRVSK
jgi:hypothetical protein